MSVQFLYYKIWNSIVILEIFFFLIGSGECVLSSKTLIQLMATDVESLITSKLIPDVIGNFFLFFACKNHIFFTDAPPLTTQFTIEYENNTIVDYGNVITPEAFSNQPINVHWPAKRGKLYTLMMVG
jgi:hypothetical protein